MSNLQRKFKDQQVIAGLLKHQGNMSMVARELGVTSQAIKNRMARSPRIQEEIDQYNEELVDLAIIGLKAQLVNGNSRLIEYTLDRLGKSRGFEKQSVKHDVKVSGDPNNPITISKTVELNGLSDEEKLILMKTAKRKMEEMEEDCGSVTIDAEEVFDNEGMDEPPQLESGSMESEVTV